MSPVILFDDLVQKPSVVDTVDSEARQYCRCEVDSFRKGIYCGGNAKGEETF